MEPSSAAGHGRGGLFVTFEGGDGSGKSTQLRRIAERLRAAGHDPLLTREPGGTPLAEGIRALLLDPARSPNPTTEAFLIEAARADLMERVIAPALAAGRLVLCDRHTDSTLAYQGYGRGLDRERLRDWNRAAAGEVVPDLTLLFDIEPQKGLERRSAAGTPNRLDGEPLDFHRRVREGFLELARASGGRMVVLDASLPADQVEVKAWEALEPLLARAAGRPFGGAAARS